LEQCACRRFSRFVYFRFGKSKTRFLLLCGKRNRKFQNIAEVIQNKLKLNENAVSLNKTDAAEIWGEMMATVAFGSDCRLNTDKARLFLDWKPKYHSVLNWIEKT